MDLPAAPAVETTYATWMADALARAREAAAAGDVPVGALVVDEGVPFGMDQAPDVGHVPSLTCCGDNDCARRLAALARDSVIHGVADVGRLIRARRVDVAAGDGFRHHSRGAGLSLGALGLLRGSGRGG